MSAYLCREMLVFPFHYPGGVWGERVANGGIWECLTSRRMGRKASLGSRAETTISGVHSVSATLRSPQQLKPRKEKLQGSPTNHTHVQMHLDLLTNALHSVQRERYHEKDRKALWSEVSEQHRGYSGSGKFLTRWGNIWFPLKIMTYHVPSAFLIFF